MKRLALFTAAVAAFVFAFAFHFEPARPWRVALTTPAQARTSSVIQFSFFFDSLRPYGHWAKYRPYGWVFIPRVPLDWRPYTLGHWAYEEEYGWLWVSDEPFGWATFHYGWWDYDERWGWFWVPGYDWAPSWVVWRSGIDFIGWAPIPAHFVWGRHYSDIFDRWDDRHWRYANAWCFTRKRHIGFRHAAQVIVPARQNSTYIRRSRAVHNTAIVRQGIVNRGIDVASLEREAGTFVPRAEIRAVNVPPRRATAGEGSRRVVVNAFRPDPAARVARSAIAAQSERQALPAELANVAALAPELEPTVPGPALRGSTRGASSGATPDDEPTGAIQRRARGERLAPESLTRRSAPIGTAEQRQGHTPPADARISRTSRSSGGSFGDSAPEASQVRERSAGPRRSTGLQRSGEVDAPAARQTLQRSRPESFDGPPAFGRNARSERERRNTATIRQQEQAPIREQSSSPAPQVSRSIPARAHEAAPSTEATPAAKRSFRQPPKVLPANRTSTMGAGQARSQPREQSNDWRTGRQDRASKANSSASGEPRLAAPPKGPARSTSRPTFSSSQKSSGGFRQAGNAAPAAPAPSDNGATRRNFRSGAAASQGSGPRSNGRDMNRARGREVGRRGRKGSD